MSSDTIEWADVPQTVENLKTMKTIEVAMAYRSADFNLYGNSVMMLTLAELERRAKKGEQTLYKPYTKERIYQELGMKQYELPNGEIVWEVKWIEAQEVVKLCEKLFSEMEGTESEPKET